MNSSNINDFLEKDSSRFVWGLLLTGGLGPSKKELAPYLEYIQFIVAADSGFDLALNFNLDPDFIVGDFDSIKNSNQLKFLPKCKIKKFDRDKDMTDTELGINTLIKLGANQLIIAGGGGGRFDHQLALLRLFETEEKLRVWLTESEEMIVIKDSSKFMGHKNSTISFFPLTDFVQINSSTGFRWPLDGLRLERGQASVSNIITEKVCRVSLESGRLLMIRNLKKIEVS